MVYVVADIEWNGAYAKKARGYFNEIIEIGAVMLDEALEEIDFFHTVIKPVVTRKLSGYVTDLTHIQFEELSDGMTYASAQAALRRWIGDREAVLVTWSTADLLVWIENNRYFHKREPIPFIAAYADAQAFYQKRMGVPRGQQPGLAAACAALGIETEGAALHRAMDDARLTGAVLRAVFDAAAFAELTLPADGALYERMQFKSYIITDMKDPRVLPAYLRQQCTDCRRAMRRVGKWTVRNRWFTAEFICGGCGRRIKVGVQVRIKYDGPEVRRRETPCDA